MMNNATSSNPRKRLWREGSSNLIKSRIYIYKYILSWQKIPNQKFQMGALSTTFKLLGHVLLLDARRCDPRTYAAAHSGCAILWLPRQEKFPPTTAPTNQAILSLTSFKRFGM
jgi:hypothetical protein